LAHREEKPMNVAGIRCAFVALILLAPALAAALEPPLPPLEGVWGAKRIFGPDVRGTLEIVRAQGGLRARIAQYDVAAAENAGRVSFSLPADQGSFTGRFEQGEAILRGQWVQSTSTTDGTRYTSPVALRANGSRSRWAGQVVPFDDELTMFVVFSADGSTAFVRNPDRNMGIFWKVDRVERGGDRVRLMGKLRGRGPERVLAEGTYRAEDKVLSMYFPLRGGSFDLVPVDDASPFHARPNGEHAYRAPLPADDGWKTGTLAEARIDPTPIAELVKFASADPKSVDDLDLH
jgi:hypothetical protein